MTDISLTWRGKWLATVAVVATIATAPLPALAQESDTVGIEDIIVNARKKSRGELAQDVPVALTAVSGEKLEDNQLTSLSQVAYNIPNVAMDEVGNLKGTANFSIRGLGVTTTLPTLESATGVFMDGVYIANNTGVVLDLFDLEGIEILRGPQGTLFGKNVTGGAVLLRSRLPSDKFEARMKASLETGLQWKTAATISGPLSDTLTARFTASYDHDDGWFRNDFDGKEYGKSKSLVLRPSLRWQPSSDVDVVLRYEYGHTEGQSNPVQNWAFQKRNSFNFKQDLLSPNDLRWDFISSEINIDVGNGTITNVAGYRNVHQYVDVDVEGTEIVGLHALFDFKIKQFSDELRYAATLFDGFDLTTGLYYFHSKIDAIETRRIKPLNGAPRSYGGIQTYDAYAVFAQGDLELSPALNLTIGARYAYDKKKADVAEFRAAAGLCDAATRACTYSHPNLSGSWDSFSPKLGLQYKIEGTGQVYITAAKAYRAGGFNLRLTSPGQVPRFDQESTSSIEAGGKFDLFDRRLRINTAAFYNKIKNMIRDVNVPGTSASGFVTDTRNTADATITGFEIEAEAAVTDSLRLTGFIGYLHGKYDKIRGSLIDLPGETPGTINAADLALKIPRLAPWTYGIGFSHNLALGGDMVLRTRADISRRDAAFSNDNNTLKLTAIETLGASTTVELMEGRLALTAFGRNLLNDVSYGLAYTLPAAVLPPLPAGVTGGNGATLNEGRVIGLEASIRF